MNGQETETPVEQGPQAVERERRLTPALAALAAVYVAYAVFLSFGSRVGFPASMQTAARLPFLADKPLGEDAYYMLTMSWNIASGKGIVYNFDRVTTGIQPLSTFVYAGLAWFVQKGGGDKWAFARAVLLFCLLCGLLFAWQCGRIVLRLTPGAADLRSAAFATAFVATLFHFSLFGLLGYGLETAIYLVLLSACVLFTLRLKPGPGMGSAILFGGLAGLTGLARIDFGVVLGLFMGWMLWKRRVRIAWALAAGVSALAVVSPWFLWVRSASGRWMPSSGSAQFALISIKDAPDRFWQLFKALIGHLAPWASAGSKYFVLLAFVSLALVLFWLTRTKRLFRGLAESLSESGFFAGWAVALAGLVAVYGLFFWAGHFYPRYTAPVLVLTLPVFALAAAARVKSLPPAGKTAVLLILPLCFFFWAARTYHRGRIAFSMTIAAGVIQKEFPPPHKVGAFQSGVLGFFNDNVYNLDGKIDPQALLFLKKGALDAYIDREEIDVLIDWPGYYWAYIPDAYLKRDWDLRDEPAFIETRSEGPPATLIWCYVRRSR